MQNSIVVYAYYISYKSHMSIVNALVVFLTLSSLGGRAGARHNFYTVLRILMKRHKFSKKFNGESFDMRFTDI